MPTLEERTMETKEELRKRIVERQKALDISKGLSNYIEQLEKHLLTLERRVNKLELKQSKYFDK